MVLPIFCARKYQKMHPTSIFFNLRPRLTDASQGSVPLVPMVPVASTATSSSRSESGESGGGAPGKKLGASRGLQVPWANWKFSHGFIWIYGKNVEKMGENPHENHVLIPSSFTFPCDSTIKNHGKMMEKWKLSSQKKKVVPLHKLVSKHVFPSNYGLICLNPTVHLLTQGISKLWFQTGTIFSQYQEIAQG
jgi:hypothetical protein